MSGQINVNIRMDKDVKEQADKLFKELGFNFTTAINAFVKQSLRERAMPFHIKADAPIDGHMALITASHSAQVQSAQNGVERVLINAKAVRRPFEYNCMSGEIWMADDFDEPLEDFKEYIE